MALTMMQKRNDFRTYLQGLLEVHDSRFTLSRVDIKERKELEQAVDRKARVKIIGDPVRYCSIHEIGQAAILGPEGSMDAAGNIDCRIGHRFDVRIFWGKDYKGSQDDFEEMAYNDRDNTKPGVLEDIRENRVRTVSNETYRIGLPAQDAFLGVVRDSWIFGSEGSEVDICHYLAFNTILIG